MASHDELSLQRVYQEYLRAMYVLFKSSFVYATNNQTLVMVAERVAAVANQIRTDIADVPSLELLPEGIYVNRVLLKVDAGTHDQADYLYTIFSTLGVSAVAAIDDTTAADWLELTTAFQRCVGPGGNIADFAKQRLPRIQLTPVSGTTAANNLLAMTNRFRALRAYATTVVAIGDVLESARSGRVLRPLRIKRPLQEMISLSAEASSLLLALAHLKRHKLTLQHHLANTAVYTLCAVRPLGLTRAAVCSLALTATMHDLGRVFALSDDADPAAERRHAHHTIHAMLGTPLASQQMNVRAVVSNEVRRWADRKLEPPGDLDYPYELELRSKIVAVAHAYSRLTTPRPNRPCLLPDEAVRVIMREAGRRYDIAAVRLFVNTLGTYPVGSTVALSDGRLAIVVEAPAAGGGQPRVKIVRDSSGSIVDGAIVDLATAGTLRVARCVDAEDLDINSPAFLLS